ncbi:hypothetical protein AADZ90_008830 [Aestuariibius sp. 2305UL40-4]|uniref:hypothetical protein n=1 Tax=Aestuariibius violaceus TaxID=3234132 RepID=UPI00345E6551
MVTSDISAEHMKPQPSGLSNVVVIAAACAVVLAAYLVILAASGTGVRVLKDTATVYQLPIFTGLVTEIGIYTLVTGAAIACFGAVMAQIDRRKLMAAGALSAVLAFDDRYLFHERLAPAYFGASEEVVILLYAIWAIAVTLSFGRRLVAPAQWPLLLSGVALFVSVALDILSDDALGLPVAEDLAKLLGFALWSGFWIRHAYRSIRTGGME